MLPLPDPCPFFRLDGEPSLQPNVAGLQEELRAELIAVRGELETLMPRVCGCSHERLIPTTYPTRESFRARTEGDAEVFARVLCPDVATQALCSHRSNLQPNVLEPQIRRLCEIGILERREWEPWNVAVCGQLRVIDEGVARRRWETDATAVEEAKRQQEPLLKDVQAKIAILQKIVSRMLGIASLPTV